MPTRANPIHPDHDLAAAVADIGDTMTRPIDLEGAIDIRVDCDCNAYSHETVMVPYVVAYDALLRDSPSDPAQLRADRRIRSVRVAGIEGKPSNDFKPLHMAQAVQTMRNRKLIPFSPFVADGTYAMYRTKPAYQAWRDEYLAARLAVGGVSMSEGTGRPMTAISADADGTWHELVDDEGGDSTPPESAVEMARSFPVDGSVDSIVEWVETGDNPTQRGLYALALEQQRRKQRASLTERLAWLMSDEDE